MKLNLAIYIIETSYAALDLIAFFGIGLSFFILTGITLAITLILLLGLFTVAFYVKLNMINIYLKKCKYPFEFLSVLQQLGLTSDVNINWSEELANGPTSSYLQTEHFLNDNNLITQIGEKKLNVPYAFIMIIVSIFGLAFFVEKITLKDYPLLFSGLLLLLVIGIVIWPKTTRRKNDPNPFLIFDDDGLKFYNTLYKWSRIENWESNGQSDNSSGDMIIYNFDCNNNRKSLIVDLDRVNIDRVDFVLLLTHFKAKYA